MGLDFCSVGFGGGPFFDFGFLTPDDEAGFDDLIEGLLEAFEEPVLALSAISLEFAQSGRGDRTFEVQLPNEFRFGRRFLRTPMGHPPSHEHNSRTIVSQSRLLYSKNFDRDKECSCQGFASRGHIDRKRDEDHTTNSTGDTKQASNASHF